MHSDICEKVKQAGVVGASGAGFPTYAKFAGGVDIVVVNGAECEPLLRVDQQLMEAAPAEMLRGLEAVMQATGATEGVIATKAKYKQGIAALKPHMPTDRMRIHLLDDFYPAGDEQVTVKEATGRVVPQGGIPLKVGCVVVNVETLLNVAAALGGKPVTHKYLTVTGEVEKPVTLYLPVGTSVAEALSLAGVKEMQGMRVIDGGPMMGKLIGDLQQPITKTTKGLIVLPEEHPVIRKRTQSCDKIIRQAKSACIQCRFCTDLCPRFLLGHRLEPHRIMRAIRNTEAAPSVLKMAFACTECGVCEQYACFMDLSPRTVNAMLKQELAKQGIKPEPPPADQVVDLLQQHRKIPVKRLIARLGLTSYDKPAPLRCEAITGSVVRIPMKQHVGAPAKATVTVGQQVRCGDLIGQAPSDGLGANVHASIDGVITEANDCIVIVGSEGRRQ